MQQKAAQYNIVDDFTEDITALEERLEEATKHFASMVNRSVELREDHIDTLIQNLEGSNDPKSKRELKALKAQKQAEKQRKLFKKLRQTLNPSSQDR
jgi:uncharacterized protein YdcH (DUF465 family)